MPERPATAARAAPASSAGRLQPTSARSDPNSRTYGPELAKRGPSSKFGPELAKFGPELSKFGPASRTDLGSFRLGVDQGWTNIEHCWTELNQVCPTLVGGGGSRFLSQMMRYEPQTSPSWPCRRLSVLVLWPLIDEPQLLRPEMTKLGPASAKQSRASLGQDPKSAEVWAPANFGPKSTDLGRRKDDSGTPEARTGHSMARRLVEDDHKRATPHHVRHGPPAPRQKPPLFGQEAVRRAHTATRRAGIQSRDADRPILMYEDVQTGGRPTEN